MTRSGAPFHGAHGEGRSAISPAASQAGAEPWAHACPARARRTAPVISDNAVVAAPMNWRAESTAIRCPCRVQRHNWLKTWQKSIDHADFGWPGMQLSPNHGAPGSGLTRNCSSTNHFRSLSEHRLGRIEDRTIAELAALLPCSLRLAA